MSSIRTTHVSPAEWRWVFIIGGMLAALTLAPYAWALAANATATDWQFMGILANPLDGATYLAKIGQGARGAWVLHFMHTPEPHAGAAIQVFYLLLGHMARLIGISNVLIFHLARVLTTFFMFFGLYLFGAAVWPRERPRRLFFLLVSLGSGLGWLLILFNPALTMAPDLTVPEAYPLYAAYANPHFPLAIGALAILAAAYVNVFRIDFYENPAVNNEASLVVVLTIIIALVLPHALIPFGATLAVYFVLCAVVRRELPLLRFRWISLFAIPAMLLGAYYIAVLRYNPVMDAVWNTQVEATSASPLLLLSGYGLLLVLAVPALLRTLRHFESDDQLMFIWLVVNVIVVLLPFNQQRRFMIGLIIPVVFFAVRSLEAYWLRFVPDRWRNLVFALLVILVIPSNLLVLSVPLFGLANPDAGLEQRLLVERGYWDAMIWLRDNGKADDVVLSSPNVGLWIPAWGSKRVVYGHPWETLDAETKLAEVEAWYQGEGCAALFTAYHVRYVMVGPQEITLSEGADTCYADLAEESTRTLQFGDVALYELAD